MAGVTAVTALLTGLGWLMASSREGRAELRPVVLAVPPAHIAWVRPAESPLGGQSMAVERFPPRVASVSFETPVLDPLGSLALVLPTRSRADDRIVTGSLGAAPRTKVASLGITPMPRPRQPAIEAPASVLAFAPALPLPRARPQLASLTPLEGLPVKPDDDAHAPRTAIYDISAKTVYLPNGERLEAHSGLGEFMDDPSSKHHKNRGVTPPNTYDLKLRESLFHGVQAIRLTPVNEDAMFGRDGMLAHSYMLGPSGQSNGCISFKDYPRFLRAFERGEIERVVVVPHLSRTPAYASRSGGGSAEAVRDRNSIF
jgi:hypothetical protein